MSKKIISNLFNYALSENAKSFVIDSDAEKITLNYHFHDGEERSFNLPKKVEQTLGSTLRQLLKLSADELINKKYCKLNGAKRKFSFHLTLIPSTRGEKIIINIVHKNNKLFRLNQLGMRRKSLSVVKNYLKLKQGLIIISSPHGHGKNTSLHALLKEINSGERSTYFIGSKTEREFDNVNILSKTKTNWTKILNIDSEVIATEIIDKDDLKNVVLAANSGRLVLATMTANSVWEILLAYLKLKLPLKQKLDGLKLIINQRVSPLKRTKEGRQEIGLFEVLEINENIKKFLLESEKNKAQENFWEKLGRLAIKDGYEPLSVDNAEKNKNGLI